MAYGSAAYSFDSADGAGTVTLAVPSGALLILVGMSSGGSDTITFPSGQGFTTGVTGADNVSNNGSNGTIKWAYKIAGGSEPGSYDISNGSGADLAIGAIYFTGRSAAALTNYLATTGPSGSAFPGATPISLSGITALALDDILVIEGICQGYTNETYTFTAPTNYTQRSSVSASVISLGFATRNAVSAGATGALAPSVTSASGGSGDAFGIVISLPIGVLSLAVDSADAVGQGQSVTMPISMPITSGQAVAEGFGVSLLFDQAYVLPVSSVDIVAEGQDIPFILTQPGVDADIVGEGQSINLLFLDTVISSDAVAEGQAITLVFGGNTSITVQSADIVIAEGSVNLTPTGIVATSENFIKAMVRSFVKLMAFTPVNIGHV